VSYPWLDTAAQLLVMLVVSVLIVLAVYGLAKFGVYYFYTMCRFPPGTTVFVDSPGSHWHGYHGRIADQVYPSEDTRWVILETDNLGNSLLFDAFPQVFNTTELEEL
jgi:hypothetical protein